MRHYEIYVVDEVKAALWWKSPVKKNQVLSIVTDDCAVANCNQCGVLHGVAKPDVLEKHGLAARSV